jgi:riboflavin kinase/FMN adenylyltransferase
MKLFKLQPHAKPLLDGSYVSVGNFDGVHLGHQLILQKLNELKKVCALPTVVVLFEPQAKEFFLKKEAPTRIDGLREKIEHLRGQGVDYVYCIRFDTDFQRLTPEEFILSILINTLHAKALVVGDDFRFGQNRLGHFDLLRSFGIQHGMTIHQMEGFDIFDTRVSSSHIRTLLAKQDVEMANTFLGHPYCLIGRVMYGRQLARIWDTPTANIQLKRQNFALNGVFCVNIRICATHEVFSGVANVGKRPTIDGSAKVLEVHLFDFNRSLYGQLLQINFLSRLREEKQFADLETLRLQILKDVAQAKAYFA